MHNQNEELFMTKKKKPSFAEWTLQNGITQKPASTAVGVGVLSSMTWFTDCLRTWFTLFVWDHCSKDKLCEKR